MALRDNNYISIEGNTAWSFSEDVATRFVAYGWNITCVSDANDLEKLKVALNVAKNESNRPTLIVVDSHIAWGVPAKQDTHGAHGAPLGDAEIAGCKKFYGLPEDKTFYVPDGVYEQFRDEIAANGGKARTTWNEMYAKYKEESANLLPKLIS